MVRDLLTQENLNEEQKLEYLVNIGLVPLREYYNKEILKHNRICFKNLELRKKRDRIFNEEKKIYREISHS